MDKIKAGASAVGQGIKEITPKVLEQIQIKSAEKIAQIIVDKVSS